MDRLETFERDRPASVGIMRLCTEEILIIGWILYKISV
jgi:hypothetical protein